MVTTHAHHHLDDMAWPHRLPACTCLSCMWAVVCIWGWADVVMGMVGCGHHVAWLWSCGCVVVVVVVVVVMSFSIMVVGGSVLWFLWVVLDKEWGGTVLIPVPVNGDDRGRHHHLNDMALPRHCHPAHSAAGAGDVAWPHCCHCHCSGWCSLWVVYDGGGW